MKSSLPPKQIKNNISFGIFVAYRIYDFFKPNFVVLRAIFVRDFEKWRQRRYIGVMYRLTFKYELNLFLF